MFRNYFITALRNIIRNKIQAFIQVLSLAIGITAVILIGLYTKNELNHDRFNEKFDRIYRLEYGDQVGLWTAPGHKIKQELPEVENVVRLVNWHGKDAVTYMKIPSEDLATERVLSMEDGFLCDSTIFNVFTLNFIQGDPETALKTPYSTVLSESTARKIFGKTDPVGRTYKSGWGGKPYTITGIIEDVKNSHLEINSLTSIVSLDSINGFKRGDPGYLNNYAADVSYMTYLLLPEDNNPSYVQNRINELFIEQFDINVDSASWWEGFLLRPLEDIYFTTGLKGEKNYCRHGNIKLLRVLITIAVFILLLGIINYVNLTTARASLRAVEVGIRKVTGSSTSRLITQFLVESVIVALVSLVIALILVRLLLPGFNQMATTDLEMGLRDIAGTWPIFLVSVIILGIIAGIYPALYLTGFQPIKSLSGEQAKGSGAMFFRRALLTFQYIISIVLIIGVLVIFRQLKYLKTSDLGFNKDLIVNLQIPGHPLARDVSKQRFFKQRLMQNPNILGVSYSSQVVGESQTFNTVEWEIDGIKRTPAQLQLDPDFFNVMEIELLEGRNFSWDRPGDLWRNITNRTGKIIVNETLVREFQIEDPVGYYIKFPSGFQMEILGVIRDFNFKSQHEKIEPTWYYWGNWMGFLNIKIAPVNIQATISYIENLVQPFNMESVFRYSFLDETYAKQYVRDEKTARIISNFAIVAILIACLGLFGLSSFMATRRTKEIGIRKTMGASVQSLFLLLSREFLKWIALSVIIACPLAWYVMNRWLLQHFAYRINIGAWIFTAAILMAFLIAFLTVTWQSLKTARTNPVEALRYE